MTTLICPNCWRDKTETQQICTLCENLLTSDLKWIYRNIQNLEDYAEKRVGTHNNHTTSYHASEPVRLNMFQLLYGPQGLDLHLRCYCACLAITYTHHDTIRDLTRKILQTTGQQYLRNTATHTYAKELHQLKNKATQLLDNNHSEQEILGPCPNPECGRQLTAPINTTHLTCPNCHNTWTTSYLHDQRRTRIINSNHVGTSIELQTLLAECGININRSTVRSWICRGKLTQAHKQDGSPLERNNKPLYKLATMYLLATGEKRNPSNANIWNKINKTAKPAKHAKSKNKI